MGCCMSVKLHFLCSHLDFFQQNLGDFSEEHGEKFHQNIEPMKKQYKGLWDSAMMGDYIDVIKMVIKEKLAQQCIFE